MQTGRHRCKVFQEWSVIRGARFLGGIRRVVIFRQCWTCVLWKLLKGLIVTTSKKLGQFIHTWILILQLAQNMFCLGRAKLRQPAGEIACPDDQGRKKLYSKQHVQGEMGIRPCGNSWGSREIHVTETRKEEQRNERRILKKTKRKDRGWKDFVWLTFPRKDVYAPSCYVFPSQVSAAAATGMLGNHRGGRKLVQEFTSRRGSGSPKSKNPWASVQLSYQRRFAS